VPRATPLVDPVTLQFDGESIVAERGEPVAAALIAAGKLALARSPKFHRPRGPSCLRAACDGCLARVDDCPNVMTCMVPAAEGTVVKTQNTLGSREVDFLRVTDWFFPKGMNHHELFAGVPGLQGIMQSFARRVAGLGKLPGQTSAPREARRRNADVVVVGGGAAGMAAASRAVEAGRGVEVLDDSLALGGTLRAFTGEDAAPWSALRAHFDALVASRAIVVRAKTTAAALYGDDLLVVGDEGAEVVSARALILAPGAHDGALAFEGNDLPAVMSARAASWLLARGITLGERVVLCVVEGADGNGAVGDAFARAATRAGQVVEVVRAEPLRAEGTARVKAVVVRDGERERRLRCDALVLDAPRAPAYELCEQAGAPLVHSPRGFVPQVKDGRIRDHIFALGEVTGAPLEPRLIDAQADAIARGLS
jgi:sarcosine oxidase subunit alpha